MSSVAALHQQSPPGDEDLAALYTQVLAGFAEESPTSETRTGEMDPPYSHYSDDTTNNFRPQPMNANRIPPVNTCMHQLLLHSTRPD